MLVSWMPRLEKSTTYAGEDYSVDQLRVLVEAVSGKSVPPDVRIQAVKSVSFPSSRSQNQTYESNSVWKPLKGPVRDWPLALCDASTLTRQDDLRPVDSVFPHGCIEGYTVHQNPKQKWCYISDQQPSELWVFNTADTGSLSPGEQYVLKPLRTR